MVALPEMVACSLPRAVAGPHRISIKVRGQWRYLYRAIDKHGTPVDFLLTAKRDLEAAKRFFRKALQEEPLLAPDRIGIDGAGPTHPPLPQPGKTACWRARRRIPSPNISSRGSRAITSGSSGPCRGSAAFRPSTRPGAPFR